MNSSELGPVNMKMGIVDIVPLAMSHGYGSFIKNSVHAKNGGVNGGGGGGHHYKYSSSTSSQTIVNEYGRGGGVGGRDRSITSPDMNPIISYESIEDLVQTDGVKNDRHLTPSPDEGKKSKKWQSLLHVGDSGQANKTVKPPKKTFSASVITSFYRVPSSGLQAHHHQADGLSSLGGNSSTTSSCCSQATGNKYKSSSYSRREVKKAQKLFVIVVFFMLCWLPLYTSNTILAFCKDCPMPPNLVDFLIILSHINSAGSPFLYAFHMKDFREALHKLIFKGAFNKRKLRDLRRQEMFSISSKRFNSFAQHAASMRRDVDSVVDSPTCFLKRQPTKMSDAPKTSTGQRFL